MKTKNGTSGTICKLIALSLGLGLAAPATAISLEETVATALDTNPEIRQAFARFKAREKDHRAAKGGYLPTIDITAGYGYEYTDTPVNRRALLGFSDGQTDLRRGEFGISLRQMIFDGMLTSSDVERTKMEASAEQWFLINAAENLALRVSQAYLNYVRSEQLVTLSEKNIEAHQVIYEQIKERTDSGIGSIADLSQVTGRLARAQSNLIAAKNNLLDAQYQFVRLTNVMPKDLVSPVPDADMLPKSRSVGLSLALEQHPVLKASRRDINAARALVKSIDSRWYPTITLEVAANADNDLAGESGFNRFGPDVGGHRNDFSAMVRMRYNLYAGGRDSADSAAAEYRVNEAREINDNAHLEVSEGYSLAWNAYEMLGQQKGYLREHVETSKQTQEAYSQQFNLGQRTLLDLLDTENELFEARQDYLAAHYDELGARYRVLNATGQLLDSLRITRSSAWLGENDYEQGE